MLNSYEKGTMVNKLTVISYLGEICGDQSEFIGFAIRYEDHEVLLLYTDTRCTLVEDDFSSFFTWLATEGWSGGWSA